MIRHFLTFLIKPIICIGFSLNVVAQTCDNPQSAESTRVYFVNGMNNEQINRKEGVDALTALMGRSYEVRLSTNNLEKGLEQFLEVFRQRENEPSLFWAWFTNLSIAPEWFTKEFADYVVGHAYVEFATDADLRIMINQYLLDLQSGKKVILVSHSQGNFYANNAYQFIAQTYPQYAGSMSIVSLGSPSGRVLGGGRWHTNSLDKVIQIVNLFYQVLPSTFTFNSPNDNLNHNFIRTYLVAQGSKIRSDVLALESALEAPPKHPDCDPKAKIETIGASAITHGSAIIEGSLLEGAEAEAWLIYGTNIVFCSKFGRTGAGNFTAPTAVLANITNLQSSKRYIYRACAMGKDKTLSSGSIKYFTTLPNPTPPPPTIPCSGQAYQGGTNGLVTIFDFGSRKGVANIGFEAFTVPDKMEIFKFGTNQRLASTPGFVSGYNYGNFTVDSSFSKVRVEVTGNTISTTLWELTVNCPN